MWNFAQRGQPMDRKDRHVATVLAGIRRTQGRPPEQKEAILPEDLLAMIATLDLGELRGLRDRAILLIGFAGGLRRSEIVGLDCRPEDGLSGGWIEFFDDGLLLTLRGKTGWREVEIGRGSSDATCPVVALETWLKFARISIGPLFRRVVGGKVGAERLTDRHVARLVKRAALAAGVRGDLTEGERERKFSGPFAARRPRLLGRGRRALRAEAARPRLRRNDPPLPAPPRPIPGQSHQGGGLVSAESGPRRPLPCPAGTAPQQNRVFRMEALRTESLSRLGQREIDMHGVIGKHHARLRLIEDAGMKKRRHVAVDGLDVPADPARHLADRQCALAGHRSQNLPTLLGQGVPKQIDRVERDVRALLLAAERGGGAARNLLTRGDRKGHAVHPGLH